MIRPWYRSRLFWLGLPGLVFLCFSWGRGGANTTSIWWSGSRGALTLCDDNQRLEISWIEGLKGFGFQIQSDSAHPEVDALHRLSPLQVRRFPEYHFPKVSVLVAYWMLLLLYLVVWLGALAGWQRRKARLIRRAAAELSGS